MKKILIGLFTIALVFSLAACGSSTEETANVAPEEVTSSINSESKQEETVLNTDAEDTTETQQYAAQDESTSSSRNILIAYFSKTGNTEAVANMIAEQTGGELFKIETVTPYPDDYNETVDIAREEQNANARPELSTHMEDMSQYDVIYLGYPNWWGTMPMAMFTFLEEYDFAGKTIIPFCTHGGSELGRSEDDIADLVPDAILLKGLAVRGSEAENAQDTVAQWLDGLELAE